jgi:hypothetical protein
MQAGKIKRAWNGGRNDGVTFEAGTGDIPCAVLAAKTQILKYANKANVLNFSFGHFWE